MRWRSAGGTDFRQKGFPLFTGPIEHHDKRTLTVGGACESVQNQFRSFPFRHRRRVYVFIFTSLSQRGTDERGGWCGAQRRDRKNKIHMFHSLFSFRYAITDDGVTRCNLQEGVGQTKTKIKTRGGGG